MSDKKISQLTALSAANVASATDVLAIVDTSATETKKITAKDLIDGALNGGTANGVLYLNGSKVATSGSALTFDGTIFRSTQLNIGTAPNANSRPWAFNGFGYISGASGNGIEIFNSSTSAYGYWTFESDNRFSFNAFGGHSWTAGGTEGMRLTSTGLGIGTSSPSYKLDVSSDIHTSNEMYLDNGKYLRFKRNSGGLSIQTLGIESGTDNVRLLTTGAFNIVNGSLSNLLTLDASGNLGVGETSPSVRLHAANSVAAPSASSGAIAYFDNTNTTSTADTRLVLRTRQTDSGTRERAMLVAEQAGTSGGNLAFWTRPDGNAITERARITSGGYFKASNTGGYDNATGAYHELLNNDASDAVVLVTHFGATNPLGIGVAFTAASPDDNTQYFLRCADSTTARCFIYSDGDLANHDGVYGTISDERLKQDIVDAPSQWDDLKAVRFRKYRMKTDVEANPNAPALLGVVAQELEQTSPGLIDEHPNDDGTTTKTVKSSILLMKAAVALQEAMARIEQLEADVAAMKGAA